MAMVSAPSVSYPKTQTHGHQDRRAIPIVEDIEFSPLIPANAGIQIVRLHGQGEIRPKYQLSRYVIWVPAFAHRR
jgi:hypothetical protein